MTRCSEISEYSAVVVYCCFTAERTVKKKELKLLRLMAHRGLAGLDCQHIIVIDEFLCMVSGCALETDVCHWMFKTKVNMVQGQEDAPLR